jgi:Glycosyltransferase family 92
MIKNERPWIREWIEFYLMMGVDHFLIYDDSSNDRPREILGHYIDTGLLTHIIWPNTTHPQWSQVPDDADRTDKVRGTWFNQSLRDCLEGDWMHRKQPCQLSAFTDAILRAKKRGSRWLAVLDIDEYIFPRRGSGFENLVDLLKENHDATDHLIIQGVKFGTEGHVEYPIRRKPGDELHALLTESYTMRAQLNGTLASEFRVALIRIR